MAVGIPVEGGGFLQFEELVRVESTILTPRQQLGGGDVPET